ncbi:MAG: FdtA/QdtA family cupin domain-containing protein [Muribaculaceae bacterium]|nr:WxcM-like domain-containing protein [Bacteroides sp.]MBD5293705.1 WxcM-like domain-containing protein [Bacteroides sp.]MBD5359681.1 WxcM-like domain-containing protein [Bacteroides sp.]MDE6262976.1 FdtA/QdtA family cupin domain-containing protein [Muribaculaceae bacterium]
MKRPEIIHLPQVLDNRGNLSFVEQMRHIPFEIRRTYWIYDVPGGEQRGSHAFKNTEVVIIALSGSFDVCLTNGEETLTFSLNRSYYALYIPAGWWRTVENFSTNSFTLVLASTDYDPDDYIRDFEQFKGWKKTLK